MTDTMQMLIAVSSAKSIDAIGKDSAEAIFYAIANDESADGRMLIDVARLANVIGRDEAEAIFNRLSGR